MTLKETDMVPHLNGLVLAGGKSIRMGQDKGTLQWHKKEQRYYTADMLSGVCREVFISCRPEQENEIDKNYKTIKDQYEGSGPFGAILSAFKTNASCAWLVVACDLPLLDNKTIDYLIEHRNAAEVATTFQSPYDNLPEPLITIWEPAAYPLLLSYLAEGRSCPRKVLLNNKINLLLPPNPDALLNANTKEDAEKVYEMLTKKKTIV